MNYKDVYAQWLNDPYFDDATRAELAAIADDEKEIEERFYKNLEFGTGGLRGIIGAGANRMNVYTVRKATQGLAAYILRNGPDAAKRGVAIAYDSRRYSKEFAETAALVLCGNGIRAFLFESLRPTPELSFTVRRLGCIAGVVVTASHNPPEYNGYKVYWEDGGQVQYPRDQAIIDEIENLGEFSAIKLAERETAIAGGLLTVIGKELDDAFMEAVLAHRLNPGLIKDMADNFKIVYTPLNGAGSVPVRRALREAGFKNVYIVPEQAEPDPNFTTIGYPNPEDPKAFNLAVRLLDEKEADIAVATDPDSDRVAAVIKHKGEYLYISGNIMGVLLAEYILSRKKALGSLPEGAAVISTVVSTKMTKAVCDNYGAAYHEVLTGFKYIGERIKKLEELGRETAVFSFEESIGYLIGTHARDKDAVTAAMCICEMAAAYKSRGMDLYDGINELYNKYGYYIEQTRSIAYPGVTGIADMKRIMADLRERPVTVLAGVSVTEYRDYLTQIVKRTDGTETSTGLPVSDVLYYTMEDGGWFCVRPSGTEPKIKIYCGVRRQSPAEAEAALKALAEGVAGLLNGGNNERA